MRAEAEAFAPGHITGFFQILDEATDPAQIGSRGAGFSVDKGVRSRVRVDDKGYPGVSITINGQNERAETTQRAVELLLGRSPMRVDVEQRMELPMSQGFGMSAAGALSTALALGDILQRPREEAVWAAHCAEVFNRTGLGDVVGANVGGFEVRREPGLPPYGRVERWQPEAPLQHVYLCVVSEEILTRRVLTDSARRAEINRVGARCVETFGHAPGVQRFAELSRQFSIETRLASSEILRLYETTKETLSVAQCMLGGSVFALGHHPKARQLLSRWGKVYEARIDTEGARVKEPRRVSA